MSEIQLVLKDVNNQHAVPSIWRNTLFNIVEAFKDGDFCLDRKVVGVRPIPEKRATAIANNIKDYGAHLISLPEETWKTSISQWMGGWWEVMIDLYTVEGRSDLVLAVRVYEEDSAYAFEVHLVYVP